jgi:hypothetical protein
VFFAICLGETAICSGSDVESLIPLAFRDVGGAGAVDGAKGRGGVEGEGVWSDADDWALWASGYVMLGGLLRRGRTEFLVVLQVPNVAIAGVGLPE